MPCEAKHDPSMGESRPRRQLEDGMTLIELMVAMLLLSVILMATASSLIAFTRSIHVEEHRLVATSLLAESNEQFQSVSFELAGVYHRDLDDLAAVGVDSLNEVFQDDGADLPIVVLVDPDNTGCSTIEEGENAGQVEPCGEEPGVEPAYQQVRVGSFDFELFRVVTWSDRTGDGIADAKRFTSIIRWDVLGRDYEERFDIERAATRAEAGAPTDLQLFASIGPTRMVLNQEHQTTSDIRVYARTTRPVVPGQVRLQYYAVDSATLLATDPDTGEKTWDIELIYRDVNMEHLPGSSVANTEFVATIPAGVERFTNGTRVFRVRAQSTDNTVVEVLRTIRFTGDLPFVADALPEVVGDPNPGGGSGGQVPTNPSLGPVEITSVSVDRTTVRLRNNDNNTRCSFTVRARISGLETTDGQVEVVATGLNGGIDTSSFNMDPDGAIVSSDGHDFVRTFEEGSNLFSENDQVRFEVTAKRPSDGEQAVPVAAEQLVVFTKNSVSGCN